MDERRQPNAELQQTPAALSERVAFLEAALGAERQRLQLLEDSIRRVLEQPDLDATLREMVHSIQTLGWQRVTLTLFGDGRGVERRIAAGSLNGTLAEEPPLPEGMWERLAAGDLERWRFGGLYFVPDGHESDDTWRQDDLVFAPLQVGADRPCALIVVAEPADGLRPGREALRALDVMAGGAAYVVENARLLAAAEASAAALADQVEELSMVHRADRELSSHLDLDRVMRLTMDWALRRTGADTGLLALMTPDGLGLVPLVSMGHVNREAFPLDDTMALPVEHGILGQVARTGESQVVDDAGVVHEGLPFMPTASSAIAVPLAMRGEVLGVVALASPTLRQFGQQDVSFLERLAQRSAVALDNARLFRQSEQLAADMGALYSASRTITSTLERDEILRRIAQSLTTTVECSSTVIYDYVPELNEVQVLAVYRADSPEEGHEILGPPLQRIPLDDAPAFQMAVEQQHPLALRARDPAVSAQDRAQMQQARIHALLLVPLVAQDELIGLAALIEGRRDRIFTPGEVYKAESLASQASVTLRQSILFAEVRELEQLKSEMIRMATHDLRNPLNNAMGFLSLLQAGLARSARVEDMRSYAEQIDASLRTMRTLLEDLLTLERIESERETHWQRFALSGLVAEVVEAQAASAGLKQHTITADCDAADAVVLGSVTQLRQAIANLLGNAIKYTPEGGAIALRCMRSERRVLVTVEDNGYGVAPERQPRLFERFYRAREPGTEHIGGTGLGLSLVKTVVERHGGDVWVTSAPGTGSTFGFWLPAADNLG